MKDVLSALTDEWSNQAIETSIRPVTFVSPNLGQDKLIKIFREKKTHMVIVQEPSTKKNMGLVTLEDVIEDLVGEIVDEHGN